MINVYGLFRKVINDIGHIYFCFQHLATAINSNWSRHWKWRHKWTTQRLVWSHLPNMRAIGIMIGVSIISTIHANFHWYNGKFYKRLYRFTSTLGNCFSIKQRWAQWIPLYLTDHGMKWFNKLTGCHPLSACGCFVIVCVYTILQN